MCLLIVAHQQHPDYELIVAANRDEFYDRPALPADFWPDAPHILGGRDQQGNGSWLAVNRQGGFAAITNVRMPGSLDSPRSRGLIISDFLNGKDSATRFTDALQAEGMQYNGFNIIARDESSLAWYSNRSQSSRVLRPGLYGLSNHLLDTPWPKVTQLKDAFRSVQSAAEDQLIENLFEALASEQVAPDPELPDTGLDLAYERVLSPIFINGETYGTRCSTIILMGHDGHLKFLERRFGSAKTFLGESVHEFEIASSAI